MHKTIPALYATIDRFGRLLTRDPPVLLRKGYIPHAAFEILPDAHDDGPPIFVRCDLRSVAENGCHASYAITFAIGLEHRTVPDYGMHKCCGNDVDLMRQEIEEYAACYTRWYRDPNLTGWVTPGGSTEQVVTFILRHHPNLRDVRREIPRCKETCP